MASSKPSIPKGTRDFTPAQMARRSYIIDTIKKNFKKYGFEQIETPAMEQLSVLTGKYGDEGDQLLFKILNSGDFLKKTNAEDYKSGSGAILDKISEKGLRYDLTVPFARFVVQNRNDITFPFRRFQIQPVWRADRPQRGRYREFYQCDADIIGSDSLWNETELTLLIHEVYNDLGYDGFLLKINHRELLWALAKYAGLEGKEMAFCVSIDKLDKIGEAKVREELLGMGGDGSRLQELFQVFEEGKDPVAQLAKIKSMIGENVGIVELEEYFQYLSLTGHSLRIALDFSLARGLSYYTGMIFEVKAIDVNIGSITGGGRYDNLTGVFGLEGTSGVGISFGLDRIYDVLDEKRLFPEYVATTTDLLIAHFDKESFQHGMALAYKLRKEGLSVELYPDLAKPKKQFNYADKKSIPYVMVIGSEEIKSGSYTLKDMKTGDQHMLSLSEVAETITSGRH